MQCQMIPGPAIDLFIFIYSFTLSEFFSLSIWFHALEESEETLKTTKEVQKKAEEKYKVLENKMKNAEAEREKELKAAQQKLNQAKSKADAFNKRLKERQQVT